MMRSTLIAQEQTQLVQYRAPARAEEGLWPTNNDLTQRKAFDYTLPMIDNGSARLCHFSYPDSHKV